MKPIFITVSGKLPLIVVPDSRAHADGHPVLTYTYSIFHDRYNGRTGQGLDTEELLSAEKKDNPDYLGEIIFEQPGKLFNYIHEEGQPELLGDEVGEVIEQISEYRDSPEMWEI